MRHGLMVLIVAATSLAGSSVRAQEEAESYFPARVGARWTYRTSGGDIEMRCVAEEKIGDQKCFKIETRDASNKLLGDEHVAVKKSGLYRYAVGGTPIVPPLQFLKTPYKEEESYSPKKDAPTMEWTIGRHRMSGTFHSGKKAAITLHAGTKEAKKHDETVTSQCALSVGGNDVSMIYYFAKGVGMVRQVVRTRGATKIIELKRFETP